MDNQTLQNTSPSGQKNGKSKERRAQLLGLRIVGDFGPTIAIPVIIFSWAGKQLDIRFHTGHFLLIAGFALAFILSAISIYRKAKKYARLYKDI